MAVMNFRDLIAWQKAMDLTELVYRLTERFPKTELYGLTSQMRRAAVSIPSNIAEGQGRRTTGEFLNFLSVAYGSTCELQTQVLLSARLKFCEAKDYELVLKQSAEVARLLNGLSNSLQRKTK